MEDRSEQEAREPGHLAAYRELIEAEIKAVVADDTLDSKARLALLASLDLMVSKRPAARAAGLKNYLALSGLGPRETAEQSRAALLKRIRQRAAPPSHWPPEPKG